MFRFDVKKGACHARNVVYIEGDLEMLEAGAIFHRVLSLTCGWSQYDPIQSSSCSPDINIYTGRTQLVFCLNPALF